MEYARFIHPKHYDPTNREFKRLAFKTVGNGGASGIRLSCVEASGLTICQHSRKYYDGNITGEPPVFLIFDDSALPDTLTIEQTDVGNSDKCHHDVFNKADRSKYKHADKALKAIVKALDIYSLRRCRNGHHTAVNDDDIADFVRIAEESD